MLAFYLPSTQPHFLLNLQCLKRTLPLGDFPKDRKGNSKLWALPVIVTFWSSAGRWLSLAPPMPCSNWRLPSQECPTPSPPYLKGNKCSGWSHSSILLEASAKLHVDYSSGVERTVVLFFFFFLVKPSYRKLTFEAINDFHLLLKESELSDWLRGRRTCIINISHCQLDGLHRQTLVIPISVPRQWG